MAKRRRKRMNFLGPVVSMILVAAFALLITVSGFMEKPFLPTWQEIFQQLGLTTETSAEPLDTELEVHVIDVGNADAIFLRNGSASMLIDAGVQDKGDDVVSYLRQCGVERLNIVVATHADSDHIGGMKTVIQEMKIDTFIMSFMPEGFTPTTATYLGMLEALEDKGLSITEAKAGDSYSLGEAKVDILGPVKDFEEKNNQSVVCKVTFGIRKFLFMGDAEKEAEKALLEAGTDLSADVLKAGHHGSSTSSTLDFLNKVRPENVLITCGAGNSYGHPHKEIIDTFEKRNVRIFRSDLCGNIIIRTNGNTLDFTTEK